MAGEHRVTITLEYRPIFGARGLIAFLWRPVGGGGWRLSEVE
jgi:hypothetical protein